VITLFNLGRPGHHLRHVVVYVDVAAGKDVGRSRGEVGQMLTLVVENDCQLAIG